MTDYNKTTVDKTVLCIINNGSCYRKLSNIIKYFKKGDYTPQWLEREINEYIEFSLKWYLREYCDRSTKISDIWTHADIEQIRQKLVHYYSRDGEDDLIPPAIANIIRSFQL
jgi:hypothetical protein